MLKHFKLVWAAAAFGPLVFAGTGDAQINFPVTITDPGGAYSAYYGDLTTAVQTAGAQWAHHLSGSADLEVEVVITDTVPFSTGASATSGFVRNDGTRDIFEQGAVYEIRTGTDPNGSDPDIVIMVNPDYLTTNLWYDPQPAQRTDPIPANRTDAISIFTHELGHCFVFNGWMDGTTGALPATYMSTFDENVSFDSTNFFFLGANAQTRYGGQVPITYGNPFHLGNSLPRPGSNLISDLMNGIVFNYSTRYRISALDLAIAKDCGVGLLPLNIQATSVSRLANRHIVISGRADNNSFVDINASTQPGGVYARLATVASDGTGAFSFEDVNAGSFPSRFYTVSYP